MALSNIFKFTQGLGQGGHQIGRKVGDAIEILILGLIKSDPELANFLVIEDGVEGATSAKHKVEFSFYNLDDQGNPLKGMSEELFGIIECKKVGVEQTIKQSFKNWAGRSSNFYTTSGYSFVISPICRTFKWLIHTEPILNDELHNIKIIINKVITPDDIEVTEHSLKVVQGNQILFASDLANNLHIKFSDESLAGIEEELNKCIIIQIIAVQENKIVKVNVNEALAGPQTPEKAKQASFVSLDVRKKVLGSFDKTTDDSFISILVIGESGHWEEKSRSMIRLCNDYNLYIADDVIVSIFEAFREKFGDRYQSLLTKSNYINNREVKFEIDRILTQNNFRILRDLDSNEYVKFSYLPENGKNKLKVVAF